MKKLILPITLCLVLLTSNSFAQFITNYNLGKGYNYFKSSTKSQFIKDLVATTQTAPRYMGSIASEQDIDSNSFLNLLRVRNGDLAQKYHDELYSLDDYFRKNFYLFNSDNEKFYQFAAFWTKRLEIISDYYKNTQNVYTEMEFEQNAINESYARETDSIVNLQKLKFIKQKEKYSTQLNIANQDSNKFQRELNTIYAPINKKYNASIDLLKKEKKGKINQLPQANFVRNKEAITTKYDNLISQKVSQANLELKNAYKKYMVDNERQINEHSVKTKQLTSNISSLGDKLNDINNNLDVSLPTKPIINETKYQERLNQISDTRKQKLATLTL
jgi:hypothetical protein